jgi:hypothetical protein
MTDVVTATIILGVSGEERLRRLCQAKNADFLTAAEIVRKVFAEFPDEHGLKVIDGCERGRVSYGRSLARRVPEHWSAGLEIAVWEFLVGD